jgi:hypothetical protein
MAAALGAGSAAAGVGGWAAWTPTPGTKSQTHKANEDPRSRKDKDKFKSEIRSQKSEARRPEFEGRAEGARNGIEDEDEDEHE